ncbi:SR-related and CTD-associated factor 8-like [Uloborus diversus]|uniref:SR-related and CTD-associated factor 8-like n=1 Tax=Uloborus diversus TaxID=327109 RepID=UPI00240A510C|nr:SR-related and CTD-associated factor 8-like [Uloborus diversus]
MDSINSQENTPRIANISAQVPTNDVSIPEKSNAAKNELGAKIAKDVLTALRGRHAQEGSSLQEIKYALACKGELNVHEQANDIFMFLKDGVKSGLLTLTGGKYKIAERARRRRRSSGGRRRKSSRRSGGRKRYRRSGGRKRSRSRRRRSSGRRKASGGRRSTRRRRSRKHKHVPGDECDM